MYEDNVIMEAQRFIDALKIEHPILGISFLEICPENVEYYKDTACTALARSFWGERSLVLNSKEHPQLCPGAKYFLKLDTGITDQDTIRNYVDDERVFENDLICEKFLSDLPRFPDDLVGKYIAIKPLDVEDIPRVIIMLVSPAQAGRIIGLINHSNFQEIRIIPSQSTCVALFAPLVTNLPHINFLDYYDRYYQGVVGRKFIWPEGKMILSMTLLHFEKAIASLDKSAHGIFKPSLNPQEVDEIKIYVV